ncbi:MAG: amidase [Solirubrobacteraceae bacterium]
MLDPTILSAFELADAIRRRQLTARQVVDAHISRLSATQAQINAVAADRYQQAQARADEIDSQIGRMAMKEIDALALLPLLTGVPFTVKESFAVEGMPNTAGVLARAGHLAGGTATVVARLIEAGAIPVAVTNTSELTLWIESENRVYGRTNNPYDLTRTAGGSSGGDGAAVAVGGSPFGVAADLAGSIRIPALFCGVFGHKPTSGLVPSTGMWPAPPGGAVKLLSVGPIARRASDLMPLLQIMAGLHGNDPSMVAAQLRDPAEVQLEGLTVTLVEGGGLRAMGRELRDARERAAGALAASGAQVRRIDLPSWKGMVMPFIAALKDTGNPSSAVRALLAQAGEPDTGLTRLLLGGAGGHTIPTRLALLADALPSSLFGGRSTLLRRAEVFANELQDAIGDGVLLHPAYPTVAPRHHHTYGRPWLLAQAAAFNLAGVPVTEAPLGFSRSGLPLGVQVAASPGADHVSIAVAVELEAVFGGWTPPRL